MPVGPIHKFRHPKHKQKVHVHLLAGTRDGDLRDGSVVTVVDWFDRVNGDTWQNTFGDDPRSMATGYANRRKRNPPAIRRDDEVVVVYTRTGQRRAVHETEIGELYGSQEE